MDASRILRNKVSIENELVDLREVISSDTENIAAAAQHRNNRVVCFQPDVSAYVLGDRTSLIQVVGNLIGNSVRHTPEGGAIEVALTAQGSKICIL